MKYYNSENMEQKIVKNGFVAAFPAQLPSIFNTRGGVYDMNRQLVKLSAKHGGNISPCSIGDVSIVIDRCIKEKHIKY